MQSIADDVTLITTYIQLITTLESRINVRKTHLPAIYETKIRKFESVGNCICKGVRPLHQS